HLERAGGHEAQQVAGLTSDERRALQKRLPAIRGREVIQHRALELGCGRDDALEGDESHLAHLDAVLDGRQAQRLWSLPARCPVDEQLGVRGVTGPTASRWPPLSTTLLSQLFQPPAAMRMRRTPEGAAMLTGAAPLSTPSTLTCAPCGTAVTVRVPHALCRRTRSSWRAPAPWMVSVVA